MGRLCIGTTITEVNTGTVDPVPRAGTADGSKVIHAANVYRPSEMPPRISKDKHTELHYVGMTDGSAGRKWCSKRLAKLHDGRFTNDHCLPGTMFRE